MDDNSIDTYEELLQGLLAGTECLKPPTDGSPWITCCEKFSEQLAGSGLSSVAEAACESLIDLGADQLRGLLVDLDPDSGSVFIIGTAEPCKFADGDNNMVVDNFGSPNKPCMWAVDLTLGGYQTTLDAAFWGVRKN